MKPYLLPALFLMVLLTGCKKDATTTVTASEQAAIDDAKIQAYIKTNNITAVKDASGLYYQVLNQGSGSYPTITSSISVSYTGKLLDGTLFDSGSLNYVLLASLIQGWQIGIPHINTGGRILLIVPSGLGYGTIAQGIIPANSVLVFMIDLLGYR